MRSLALLFATIQLLASCIAAYLMWFVATFPWENQPAETTASSAVLEGAAGIIFVLAVALFVSVVLARFHLALAAFASHGIAAVVILSWALQGSDHSDGKLVAFAVVVELSALAAAALCPKPEGARTSERAAAGS